MAAQLQALAGLHDELAGPIASTILADPSQHDSHAVVAALVARAVISWDNGQVGEGLDLLRDAARHGAGISPDARDVQPLLALAAALIDVRQLDEAEEILDAADQPDAAWHPGPGGAVDPARAYPPGRRPAARRRRRGPGRAGQCRVPGGARVHRGRALRARL